MPNAILDVTYGASDIERACQFYDAALGALGIKRNSHADEGWACWGPDYEADGVGFCICKPFNGKQCTAGNGTMVTFAAHSAEAVRAFHSAALALGSLRAARAWMVSRPGVALYEALRQLLASEYGRPDWLLAYWSKPVLFSAAARRAWIEPDLQQLPF